MSGLTPFASCIARPDEGERRYPLEQHLLNVKQYMEEWVRASGIYREQQGLIQLMGLAGCCHDIAKSHRKWQAYIRSRSNNVKGPPHAPAGAFLFSYLAYHLLHARGEWRDYKRHWLWMIRDVADHHGRLKDLSEVAWVYKYEWNEMDLEGIEAFFKREYRELANVSISVSGLIEWIKEVRLHIRQVEWELFAQPDQTYMEAMRELQRLRHLSTGLIAGDRFDIVSTNNPMLTDEQLKRSNLHMDRYCNSKQLHRLANERKRAQHAILAQLAANPQRKMYTLEMPTGYGKTITSLKLAVWLAQQQRYHKIVYVAPYISILEQTAEVIRDAMDMAALEHHSLAVWDDDQIEQRTGKSQLTMESWAHEVVCTSFQQFGKAIFPKRAQDLLRRAFLQDSIILIDEPQIFSPEGWNLFLCGLESMAEQHNLRVIFLSATMPPFHEGLTTPPTPLRYKPEKTQERYEVWCQSESMDEQQLAAFLLGRHERKQAAILNTIEDAVRVHQWVTELAPEIDTRLVHGLMIPLHKKIAIRSIQHHLTDCRDHPLIVVSTQVLEAGVDVSFQHVARALPIMPSVVQAAGRVNRHGEAERGILTLFRFLRNGEKDTRSSIYRHHLLSITDDLLQRRQVWTESQMNELIETYYRTMFKENRFTASMNTILDAYRGEWSEVSKFEPFGQDLMRLPLFVPWQYDEAARCFLPEQFVRLQERFALFTPEKIYECYRDRDYWKRRDMAERKQFMILFNHYVLNVPVKVALDCVGKEDYLDNRIPYLEDTDAYDHWKGLIRHFDEVGDTII
ncbi:MAG: CRISPR-associated helicase Cas3' [Brevibacillus sp.]|nr:CRISPR-associated helicase Cas3' [Brevibacillus sp.]